MASPAEHRDATCAGRAGANAAQETYARQAARQPGTTASAATVRDSEDDGTQDAEATGPASSSRPPASSPPYWLVQHSHNAVGASTESTPEPRGIIMRDNESEDWSGRNSACWARSVEIPDYVVVNGSATNVGAFVVFIIRVETINGGTMNIRKRYSEFDDFRRRLVQTFPNFEAAVPPLPPKSVISRFRPPFLEKRRLGLQYFLNCILLNPEFSASPVLKEFLFA